jgi:hypothetical protein
MAAVKEESILASRVTALEARVAAIEEKQPKVIEYELKTMLDPVMRDTKPRKPKGDTK